MKIHEFVTPGRATAPAPARSCACSGRTSLMKIDRPLKLLCLLLGLMFIHSISSAQTIITGFTNTFPNNGNTGFYPAPSLNYWYSVYPDDVPSAAGDYNVSGTNDAGMDFTGDTNDSGSMYVYAPFTNTDDQNVFYITFSDLGKYDQSEQMQIIIITNISWYIHVDPSTRPDTNGNYGTLSGGLISTGYGREDTTYLTIPRAATNGWVLMSETNTNTFIALANSVDSANPYAAYAFGVCFDQNSEGQNPDTYPTNTAIFWIDNVTVQSALRVGTCSPVALLLSTIARTWKRSPATIAGSEPAARSVIPIPSPTILL